MNQDEAATALEAVGAALTGVSDQLTKATAEIIAAAQDTTVSPRLQAAIDGLTPISAALKTASQSLDDINPDAPTP